MLSNIVIAIMCLIVLAAGIWGWWIENGGSSDDPNLIETDETERIKEDEKN